MGMAASQARFLALTARKSNVEYQGQQINQERTALANESSNLYAQLSKMDVPTPPNTHDFYKTQYTFKTNQLSDDGKTVSYTFDEDFRNTPDGKFVTLSYKESVYEAAAVTLDTESTFVKPTLVTRDDLPEEIKKQYPDNLFDNDNSENGEYANYVINVNGKTLPLFWEDKTKAKSIEQCLKETNPDAFDYASGYLCYCFDPDTNQKIYVNTRAGDGNNCFAAYKVGETTVNRHQECKVESVVQSDIGRTTSITLQIGADVNGNPITKTFEPDCTSVMNEAAYDQAMLDYEYEKAKYNKAMSDINAKTEAIQAKDKTLELELKQLDTEQNAISTEMDAVTKVVEDNVEKTFKTFA